MDDQGQRRPGNGSWSHGELVAFGERIRALRGTFGSTHEADAALVALDTAYEELRVADEEMRTQAEEIRRLSQSQQLMRWQSQRMMQMLPVPIVTTDLTGLIRSANPAAAALIGIHLPHLLRKPLFTFVATEDRPALRAALGGLGSGARLRRKVSLIVRDGRMLLVEANATQGSAGGQEITWIFLGGGRAVAAASGDGDLPAALVQLASLPVEGDDDVGVLRRAVAICQDALGQRVTISLTAGSPAEPTALASSSQLAQAADGAQLALEEGPCVTAFAERRTVVSSDVHSDGRWPRFARDPRVQAVQGAVAVPLVIGGELLGALNVYGDVGHPPDERLVEAAELLAAGVAAVLYEQEVRHELEVSAADLERALTSRATIDQARGMIMADLKCTPDEAFEHLARLSSTRHVKLREVARQIVEDRSAREERADGLTGQDLGTDETSISPKGSR